MIRTPKKFARVKSANSTEAKTEHYKSESMRRRGESDGMSDPQPCELPPPDLLKTEDRDAWTIGYRTAWALRRARP